MTLLLDASVWLAAVDRDDPFHESARALVAEPGAGRAALDLTLYEVGNVAVRRWRDLGRATRLLRVVVTACGDRLAGVDQELALAAVSLAEEYGLTVYDAAYVAAARRHGWRLVSGDIVDLVDRKLAIAPDDAAE